MPASTDGTPDGVVRNLWRLRATGPDGGIAWTALANSTQHPDGATVELPEPAALAEIGDAAVGFARFDGAGEVERVDLTERGRAAVPLWLTEVAVPDGRPPTTTFVAFSGHGVQPGRLVSGGDLRDVGVTSADQVGAVRWYPATGEVDQIYVAPTQRRQGIASALISTAAIVTFARGWAALWGDGQRTAEGDRMRQAAMWGHRAQPLTHLAPPMTPMDQRPD